MVSAALLWLVVDAWPAIALVMMAEWLLIPTFVLQVMNGHWPSGSRYIATLVPVVLSVWPSSACVGRRRSEVCPWSLRGWCASVCPSGQEARE